VKGENPEILIIINKRINLVKEIVLIHKKKFEDELWVIKNVKIIMDSLYRWKDKLIKFWARLKL